MTLPKLHHHRKGFTLVEIMIVVAIIALLAAIAVPNFMRARKRSQATRILEDLRLIDQAIDQYMIEADKGHHPDMSWDTLKPYFKQGTRLAETPERDLLNNYNFTYYGTTGEPRASLSQATFDQLSDVAPIDFWSPYGVGGTGQ